MGRKKIPHFRIVVMDSRTRRDGAYLDQVGVYHPRVSPPQVEINEEKVLRWLSKGALPSDTVRSLRSRRGIILKHDLLKRNTPADKVSEALNRWQETVAARAARLAGKKRSKRKAKTGGEGASESPPSS